MDVYGADGLPFNTRFGNGDPIGEDVVELLNKVYEANTAREPWQAGDLLLVDNIRTAHSREPFEGPREVLVGDGRPGAPGRLLADRRGDRLMTTNGSVPPFAVISGAQVQHALEGREKQIVELVEATYRLHGAGDSVNPPSYFLRFPDRPTARIIALPASIGGQVRVDGLKWISSFPENVAAGIPQGLGRADPQRPRHRLPVRLPGELDHQRHQDGGVGGAGGRLAQPRPATPDARRVLRGGPDRPLHPHLPGRHRLVVRRDRRARPVRRQRGRLPRVTWSGRAPPAGSPCTTAPSS